MKTYLGQEKQVVGAISGQEGTAWRRDPRDNSDPVHVKEFGVYFDCVGKAQLRCLKKKVPNEEWEMATFFFFLQSLTYMIFIHFQVHIVLSTVEGKKQTHSPGALSRAWERARAPGNISITQ